MREAWIEKRRGQSAPTQLRYARQGIVTEEMDVRVHNGLFHSCSSTATI